MSTMLTPALVKPSTRALRSLSPLGRLSLATDHLACDAALVHERRVRATDRTRGLDGEVGVHDAANVVLAKDSGGDCHAVAEESVCWQVLKASSDN
jgi:hypothetical protein